MLKATKPAATATLTWPRCLVALCRLRLTYMNDPARGKKTPIAVWSVLFVLCPPAALAILSALHQNQSPPGIVDGFLADCPDSPNCVCSQSKSPGHQIEPILFAGDAETAMNQMHQVLMEIPRSTPVAQTANYLHFVIRSAIFRFADDVQLLLDQERHEVQIRSASRVGTSDLGVNRSRAEYIRGRFAELNSQISPANRSHRYSGRK